MAKLPNRTTPKQVSYPSIRGKVLATYVWNNTVITDPTTVLNNCGKLHINTLYIQWGSPATNAQWQTFITEAHNRGFKVWALDGTSEWGLTANINDGLVTINAVIAYNNSVPTIAQFDGVHYDVETYNDSSNLWTTNNTDCQLQWYTSLKTYADTCHNNGLVFGGAFPQWLDNGDVGNTSTTIVSQTPAQWSKPLYEMLIDLYDQYAVMSYSIYTATQEADCTAELAYATSPKIIVGTETTNVTPTNITYYGQPLNNVLQAVNTIDTDLHANVGYLGCFIHDYTQLTALISSNPNVNKTAKRVLNVSRIKQPNR